ncbi:MAG: bifunctional phosphoribosyl-AMP cyclohydrolase/phosphoribosyl-ATP diphosphatase HisIE [Firmicutes bacterium]|nr:bifunctional phosphoribosyl-AMP cyclohydrolase/phosphoribosyl-ATP diphosphatase HisIE [Bacillota bacterium]
MSDKVLKFDINSVKFDEKGLIPAIVCDALSNRVLMQAYMDKQALQLTLNTKQAHYYSRSRAKLWKKGETSGNTQEVISVVLDCDLDCVLLRVKQKGAACHTGEPSCFFNARLDFLDIPDIGILRDTEQAIRERRQNPQKGSYTNYLFDKGLEKVCKKIAEESGETVIAAMKGDNAELCAESADLLYHLLVLLAMRGESLDGVLSVLRKRREQERERNY